MLESDGPLISKLLTELLFHTDFPAEQTSHRLLPWALRTYVTTHILFGIGILAVGVFVLRQSFQGACP